MSGKFGIGRKKNRWDDDVWHYSENNDKNYKWLKQLAAAMLIFILLYGVCRASGEPVNAVYDKVSYIMNAETDFSYWREKLSAFTAKYADIFSLEKMRNAVSVSADPFNYMIKPLDGKVIISFDEADGGKNKVKEAGIKIEAAAGEPVRAVAAGRVKALNNGNKYKKMLVIKHNSSLESVYGYLGECLVKPGDTVKKGQIIAKVAKGPPGGGSSLYFELKENGRAIDPFSRIKE